MWHRCSVDDLLIGNRLLYGRSVVAVHYLLHAAPRKDVGLENVFHQKLVKKEYNSSIISLMIGQDS